MFCKVLGCRYSGAHTTPGHKCGRCNEYGHGVLECRFAEKKEELLKQYFEEEMPRELQCTFPGCKYKWSHSTGSHNCHKCFRNHKSDLCDIIKPISEYSSLFPEPEKLFGGRDFCYIKITFDTKDTYYVRSINGEIEVMWDVFYLYENDSDLLKRFISGLYKITKNVKCPICRTFNKEDEIYDIKGSSERCSICLENTVEKFFSICGHACSCDECFKKLN